MKRSKLTAYTLGVALVAGTIGAFSGYLLRENPQKPVPVERTGTEDGLVDVVIRIDGEYAATARTFPISGDYIANFSSSEGVPYLDLDRFEKNTIFKDR